MVELFAALGLAVLVPESMLDTVTAVSGTGPALLALALEGLEDGGVAAGLPRLVARAFARRAMLGAARMLVAGDGPAAELQQRLAPPAIRSHEGLDVLEERGVRHGVPGGGRGGVAARPADAGAVRAAARSCSTLEVRCGKPPIGGPDASSRQDVPDADHDQPERDGPGRSAGHARAARSASCPW